MPNDIYGEHAGNPRNTGLLDSFTHRGVAGEPGGGPYMAMEFVVEEGVIRRAGFETYGCIVARACASMVTTLALGRPTDSMRLLEAEDLIRILGGVPEGKEHAARLAVEAAHRALGI